MSVSPTTCYQSLPLSCCVWNGTLSYSNLKGNQYVVISRWYNDTCYSGLLYTTRVIKQLCYSPKCIFWVSFNKMVEIQQYIILYYNLNHLWFDTAIWYCHLLLLHANVSFPQQSYSLYGRPGFFRASNMMSSLVRDPQSKMLRNIFYKFIRVYIYMYEGQFILWKIYNNNIHFYNVTSKI